MANFNSMTFAELRAEFIRLGQLLTAIQNNRVEVFNLMQKRQAEVRAKERTDRMTALEKDALLSVLGEP